jgi:hypothetical protein
MKIWKFPLEITDEQTVTAPVGALPLTAQFQHGSLQLWALVNDKSQIMAPLRIGIFGTGNPLPDAPGRYLSTFQLDGGALIFHVFALPSEVSA